MRYIHRNELDKACFQHDMTYGDFKDLPRRTTSDKVLRYKPFNIAKSTKHDGYRRGLTSMVIVFLLESPLHLYINVLKLVVLSLLFKKLNN